MRGPLPFDHSARNAVGMPPVPASTAKPSRVSRSTYQAAERYSRKAGSAKSQIVALQAERSCIRSSTHPKTSAVAVLTALPIASPSAHPLATVHIVGLGDDIVGLRCGEEHRHPG